MEHLQQEKSVMNILLPPQLPFPPKTIFWNFSILKMIEMARRRKLNNWQPNPKVNWFNEFNLYIYIYINLFLEDFDLTNFFSFTKCLFCPRVLPKELFYFKKNLKKLKTLPNLSISHLIWQWKICKRKKVILFCWTPHFPWLAILNTEV